jgi:hypothetical protein
VSLDLFLKRFAARPAAEAERTAVHAVLERYRTVGPDDLGTYFVTLPHGVAVELLAQELRSKLPFEGCAFRIRPRELDAHVASLVLEVARAARCVILPAFEPFTPILVEAEQAQMMPEPLRRRFDSLPHVASGAELASILARRS